MSIRRTAFAVTTEDLTYHVADRIPLAATIYRPEGPGPFPGVVSVHGGRWCAETRYTNQALDRALAQRGIVVMAIDFRLPPAARYPLPVGDINLAIRWFKRHAAHYQVAVAAIGGIGTSSGGHQLLLNALLPEDPRYSVEELQAGCDRVGAHARIEGRVDEGGGDERDCGVDDEVDNVTDDSVNASLAYLVACWPVSDPLARYRYALERAMDVHIQSHHAYWPDVAAMAEGSPQRIVEQGEATHLPPLLIIQGGRDIVLTPDMAERFFAAYSCASADVTLEKYPDEGHTFITKNPMSTASQVAIGSIGDFILARAELPPSLDAG
ncbi:alpha/beta hydrolase [Burkholderia sp. L27(2015)]|uniref:alpha/beta hydrolase n=1 Tax=Burkholderia sp. L27(2015) TaxID=1641858 RepID=UPI00131CC650|nr:alpha/beta hydrolase [Burkholderia sp. L27(2015)]